MQGVRKLEEFTNKNFGKIAALKFKTFNAARITFEVSLERWMEIEQSPEWSAVKEMIITEKRL